MRVSCKGRRGIVSESEYVFRKTPSFLSTWSYLDFLQQVNTNLAPHLTPDSSPSSSHGEDGCQSPTVAEVITPPPQPSIHLRPRKNVDYLPETPNTTSPTDARRAISAAARAQSITDHVMEIYRSYAKPKESPDGSKDKQLADLPFIEGYEPVLPAFPELSGDEMMMSDEEDEHEKELHDDPSPSNTSQRKGSKRSPRAARGQDKVSNRVAARRHREMTKERLKNVRSFRRWRSIGLADVPFMSSWKSFAPGSTMLFKSTKRATKCCKTSSRNCKGKTTRSVPSLAMISNAQMLTAYPSDHISCNAYGRSLRFPCNNRHRSPARCFEFYACQII